MTGPFGFYFLEELNLRKRLVLGYCIAPEAIYVSIQHNEKLNELTNLDSSGPMKELLGSRTANCSWSIPIRPTYRFQYDNINIIGNDNSFKK